MLWLLFAITCLVWFCFVLFVFSFGVWFDCWSLMFVLPYWFGIACISLFDLVTLLLIDFTCVLFIYCLFWWLVT